MTRVLLDANILLRLFALADPLSPVVKRALRLLRRQGMEFYLVLQTLAEFWAVATRPTTARGGLGQTPADTALLLQKLTRRFPLLEEVPGTTRLWRRLLVKHGVSGVSAHDARLVAAMQAQGLTHILTLNPADFVRYPNITIVEPHQV